MARRENFTAGILTVDESLVLPVYEGANKGELKSQLDRLLVEGSGKSVPSTVTDAAEIKRQYQDIVFGELPNKGITVLGFIHGNRKTTASAITTPAAATSRLITSIFDPLYKTSTFKVGSSDTQAGANNSSDIGLYLVSYFVNEYNEVVNYAPGRWDISKYTDRI